MDLTSRLNIRFRRSSRFLPGILGLLPVIIAVVAILPATVMAQEPELQPTPAITWQVYDEPDYGFTLEYPTGWTPEITLENKWRPEYVIKRRISFTDTGHSRIDLDIWTSQKETDLRQWLAAYQTNLAVFGSESGTVIQPNARLAHLPAIILTTEQSQPIVVAIVSDGRQIFRFRYLAGRNVGTNEIFTHILSTFHLKTVALTKKEPAFAFPPNFAFPTDVPIQIVDQTCGSLPPDQQENVYLCGLAGNCTWWAAYKRADIGMTTWGNAADWLATARSEGYDVCRTTEAGCNPIAGATAWYDATPANPAGHVAHIEAAGPLSVSEMDYYKTKTDINYPAGAPSVWLGQDEPMNGQPDGYIFGHPGDPVALFEQKGFLPGNTLHFNHPGQYNVPDSINDQVSSVSVGEGWAVKLYEHADQTGSCMLVDHNVRDLPAIGNGVSSVELFYGVCPAWGSCGYYTGTDALTTDPLPTAGVCRGADSALMSELKVTLSQP
ncbi:MAG TPA: CHAP domain-containing protein [Anaerolineae bacterium]|nr:CHAP domain-containing protein [Anaerolineae bacterium]